MPQSDLSIKKSDCKTSQAMPGVEKNVTHTSLSNVYLEQVSHVELSFNYQMFSGQTCIFLFSFLSHYQSKLVVLFFSFFESLPKSKLVVHFSFFESLPKSKLVVHFSFFESLPKSKLVVLFFFYF